MAVQKGYNIFYPAQCQTKPVQAQSIDYRPSIVWQGGGSWPKVCYSILSEAIDESTQITLNPDQSVFLFNMWP